MRTRWIDSMIEEIEFMGDLDWFDLERTFPTPKGRNYLRTKLKHEGRSDLKFQVNRTHVARHGQTRYGRPMVLTDPKKEAQK